MKTSRKSIIASTAITEISVAIMSCVPKEGITERGSRIEISLLPRFWINKRPLSCLLLVFFSGLCLDIEIHHMLGHRRLTGN